MVRLLLLAVVLIVGCAPSSPRSAAPGDVPPESAARPTTPKRLTAAIISDPPTLYYALNPAASRGGSESLQDLVNAGLSIVDREGSLRPQLATAVPSLENGQWVVQPDGRMETTWVIKPGVRWHDGTPFTANDLLFTLAVVRDPDLSEFGDIAYQSIEDAEAIDPATIRVRWSRTYIDASSLFTRGLGSPIPRHLLELTYREAKSTFTQHPYWSEQYVGTGPYRLREWIRGSHLSLQADESYVLGKPRIEQIEVRFIADGNTLAANLLAGELDLTLGKTLSLEPALQARDQWRDGRMEVAPANPIQIHPQFLNPSPAVIAQLPFRRALYHAIDRQELVDTLLAGQSLVAESWLSPNDPPEYRPIASSIVRYAYDPTRAVRLIEELGYVRGSDGMFRDASGQRLAVEIRTSPVDINEKLVLAVAHHWQQVGVAVDPVIIPPQRLQELPYRSEFPAFEMLRGAGDLGNLGWIHSRGARTVDNSYRGSGGTNYPRYMNPELDALIDRFSVAIDIRERIGIGSQIIHHMTDQLVEMPLLYDVEPTLIANRVKNVTARQLRSSNAWNAHEWDIQ